MDLVRRDKLEKPEGVGVSIFLPTHRAGTETQHDPIRLKNLLRRAEERLVAKGLCAKEAEDLIEPPRELLSDSVFWRYQSDGLAIIFLSLKTLSRKDTPSYG